MRIFPRALCLRHWAARSKFSPGLCCSPAPRPWTYEKISLCLSSPNCERGIITFMLSITCLFALQTLRGKGCLFLSAWRRSGSQPMPSHPDFRKLCLRKDTDQTQHLPGGSMTNFFSNNPKGEDCSTCLGDLSLSCCLGTLGQQRGLGCHQPPWLPWALAVQQLQPLGAQKVCSGPWRCWKGSWALKTLENQPGLARITTV